MPLWLGSVLLVAVGCVALGFVGPSRAGEPVGDAGDLDPQVVRKLHGGTPYSPYVGRNYPTRVFWGDTHLHTKLSLDAGAFGNELGMDEAYAFAKGEDVVASGGFRAKLSRPFDFLVISDHSERGAHLPGAWITAGMEHQPPACQHLPPLRPGPVGPAVAAGAGKR